MSRIDSGRIGRSGSTVSLLTADPQEKKLPLRRGSFRGNKNRPSTASQNCCVSPSSVLSSEEIDSFRQAFETAVNLSAGNQLWCTTSHISSVFLRAGFPQALSAPQIHRMLKRIEVPLPREKMGCESDEKQILKPPPLSLGIVLQLAVLAKCAEAEVSGPARSSSPKSEEAAEIFAWSHLVSQGKTSVRKHQRGAESLSTNLLRQISDDTGVCFDTILPGFSTPTSPGIAPHPDASAPAPPSFVSLQKLLGAFAGPFDPFQEVSSKQNSPSESAVVPEEAVPDTETNSSLGTPSTSSGDEDDDEENETNVHAAMLAVNVAAKMALQHRRRIADEAKKQSKVRTSDEHRTMIEKIVTKAHSTAKGQRAKCEKWFSEQQASILRPSHSGGLSKGFATDVPLSRSIQTDFGIVPATVKIGSRVKPATLQIAMENIHPKTQVNEQKKPSHPTRKSTTPVCHTPRPPRAMTPRTALSIDAYVQMRERGRKFRSRQITDEGVFVDPILPVRHQSGVTPPCTVSTRPTTRTMHYAALNTQEYSNHLPYNFLRSQHNTTPISCLVLEENSKPRPEYHQISAHEIETIPNRGLCSDKPLQALSEEEEFFL